MPLSVGSVLYVVGNGSGSLPADLQGRPHVTFNRPDRKPLDLSEIRVINHKVAGLPADGPPFVVTGGCLSADECRRWQAHLATAASDLSLSLGCLPSAGLATVYLLSRMGYSLRLYRMPLRPSLVRQPGLSDRKPLPAAFHNWLGGDLTAG